VFKLNFQFYCFVKALARADGAHADVAIPLAIMTSGDTDQLTKELMKKNKNFGLSPDQVFLQKLNQNRQLLLGMWCWAS
jgi:UDP-N-acetylglucosamine pyrophosphorylase